MSGNLPSAISAPTQAARFLLTNSSLALATVSVWPCSSSSASVTPSLFCRPSQAVAGVICEIFQQLWIVEVIVTIRGLPPRRGCDGAQLTGRKFSARFRLSRIPDVRDNCSGLPRRLNVSNHVLVRLRCIDCVKGIETLTRVLCENHLRSDGMLARQNRIDDIGHLLTFVRE